MWRSLGHDSRPVAAVANGVAVGGVVVAAGSGDGDGGGAAVGDGRRANCFGSGVDWVTPMPSDWVQ